jgi:hypothetical protein
MIWAGFVSKARHIDFDKQLLELALKEVSRKLLYNASQIVQMSDEELKQLGGQYALELLNRW